MIIELVTRGFKYTSMFSQAINEQLAAKKDEVAEATRNAQVFLMSKQASK